MAIKIQFKREVKQKRIVHSEVVALIVTMICWVKEENNCRKRINLV